MKRETSSRRVAVQRAYEAEEEACVQAIEVLLKKSLLSKKGGPETAPDDTKESENIGTATDKYSGEPAAGSLGRPRQHSRRT